MDIQTLARELEPVVDEACSSATSDRDGVVPARVRAVGPRPGLRLPGGVVGPGRYGRLARPQRAPRQPAHRGQPPVLLPRRSSDFGRDGPWGEWTRRWTAEEGRHAIVHPRLPDGHPGDRPGRARAGADAAGLDRRDARVSTRPPTRSCYTTLQELATRIAHRNTGNLLDDPAGRAVMARVAADENLHYLFYRDLASAALELDPSGDGHRDGRVRARASRCPAPASPTSPSTRGSSPRPASTTTRSFSRRCSSP